MASPEPTFLAVFSEQHYTGEARPAPGPESRKAQRKRRKAEHAELLERRKVAEEEEDVMSAFTDKITENSGQEPSNGIEPTQASPTVSEDSDLSTPPNEYPEPLNETCAAPADSNWLAAVQRGIEYDKIHGTAASGVNVQRYREQNRCRDDQNRGRQIRPNRFQELMEQIQATRREAESDRREAARRRAQEALGIFHDGPQPGVKW